MHTQKTARSKDQKKRDRAIIADMYLRGYDQFDIADKVKISRSQVAYDLGYIRKAWLESTIRDFDEAKARELTKLDKLEQECWKAWEKSKKKKETKTTETINPEDKEDKKVKPFSRLSVKKEGQTGNAAYLNTIKDCIEKRCKILGFEAPKKQEVEIKDIDKLIEREFERLKGE